MTVTALADADQLHRTVRGWNLLRLEWIARALPRQAPVTGLRDVVQAARRTADPLLLDPRFSRWCAEMVSLIERDAPSLLPAGRFPAACRDAGAFALAVRFRQLDDDQGGVRAARATVRVDHEGRVSLPGTGLVLVPGLRLAGLDVDVEIRGRRLGWGDQVAGELVVEAEPTALPGLVVSGGDPVEAAVCASDPLLTDGPPSVVVERGDEDPRAAAVPGIARVPAAASPLLRARHALAAAAHVRAVAQGARLFEPGSRPSDPPPEVAQLASAPQLIRLLAFWESAGPADGDSAGPDLGLLADWLAGAGQLSQLGADLLMRLDAASRGARLADPGAGHAAARDASPDPDVLTVTDPDLEAVLLELAGADGIEVNTIAAGRPRADPTIDQLSLIKARSPGHYAAVTARLVSPPRCLAEEILLCHCAYVDGRFLAAAAGYASLLLRLPYDIDLWRDFAFALRHLGATGACESVVFRLAEVVRRAEERVLEPVEQGHELQRLVSLIEGVNDDSDPR